MKGGDPKTLAVCSQAGARTRLVRRASLRVTDGPDRGATLELGERSSGLVGTHPDADLLLSDQTVSRRHAEVGAETDGYLVRDLGSTNGTWLGSVRLREVLLGLDAPPIRFGQTTVELVVHDDEVVQALSATDRFGEVRGGAPEMRRLFATLERAAPTEATILLEGESGTGKELLAEAVHRASARAEGPFVVLDCAGLASGVLESEIFGHEAGAFSGADRARVGLLEAASGGTIFLDEIGELPSELQPKLLRALAERQVRPIGADRYRPADVRVIAATHRDLKRQVTAGAFRADLYYRLAVIRVAVPALRHRVEDIPMLARHFMRRLRPDVDDEAALSGPVLGAMMAYAWPGNVRELRNVVERLVALGDPGSAIRATLPSAPVDYHAGRREAIDQFERAFVKVCLERSEGVVARAAEAAGISRQMFTLLMRRHGISRE